MCPFAQVAQSECHIKRPYQNYFFWVMIDISTKSDQVSTYVFPPGARASVPCFVVRRYLASQMDRLLRALIDTE